MIKPKIPENEEERLNALRDYFILDTDPEQAFDDITSIASYICETPMALISLIDQDRQWFKSKHGLSVSETSRDLSFCAHAINEPNEILEVEDPTKDERFQHNPLVQGEPHVMFYAGATLVNSDGFALGTLCVIDHQPRKLSKSQRDAMNALSRQVMAQLELRRNQRNLLFTQFSFENSPVGMSWVDEQARPVIFNDQYAKILGFKREELLEQKIYELDTDLTKAMWEAHWEEMKDHKPRVLDREMYGADGKANPVEVRIKMIDFEGKPYIHALCMDISERKRAEKVIRQNEANLSALIENSGDMIWSIDRSYRYITFNSVYKESLLKLTGEEPKPGDEINFNAFPNEIVEVWKKRYTRAFSGEMFNEEIQTKLEKGERTTENSFNPIVDESGNVIGVSVFSRDVSDKYQESLKKKRFQEGLKLLNDLASNNTMTFQQLMNRALKAIVKFLDMPLGVVSNIIDQQYEIVCSYSDEETFYFTKGQLFELSGTYCAITYQQNGVVAIEEMSNSEYHDHACHEGKMLESYIGAIITVDGNSYGTVNFCDTKPRKTPFDSYDKEFLQLFANWIGSEIARRENNEKLKLAKEKAETVSVVKDNFLSTMSHEIRTPLNAIIGMTHLLLQETPAKHQIDYLNLIRFSGENLLVLINDILDYNKIEADKLAIETKYFNLHDLLRSIQGTTEYKVKEKGILFELEYDDKLPKVMEGDPVRIAQVINNLVGNAVKFTKEGFVKLSAKAKKITEEEVTVHFYVQDSGVGIRAEKLPTIFERFVQAESSTTREYGGTGLGLSITKKLLHLMGSEIHVESNSGVGTKFFFDLQLNCKGNVDLTKVEDLVEIPQDLSQFNLRILVVEDNNANQLVVQKFLESWGIATVFAKDGIEALEKISEEIYDLVLMDLQMPRMDGYTATREIRKMEGLYFKNVPILALTASVMNNVREKSLEAGMNGYITKPFVPIELYNKLIIHLDLNIVRPPKSDNNHLADQPDAFLQKFLLNGNVDFERNLQKSYLDNLKELQEIFPVAVKERSLEKCRKIAHKVKVTLMTLKTTKLLELIEMGKQLTTSRQNDSSIKEFVTLFERACEDVIRKIEKNGLAAFTAKNKTEQ